MITYKEIVEKIFVSEETFNEILKSIPESEKFNIEDFDDLDFSDTDFNNVDDVTALLMEKYLDDYLYVYIDKISFDDKEIILDDVASFKDLEQIKKELDSKGWTLVNYEDLKEDLEEIRKEGTKQELVDVIRSKVCHLSLDELQSIWNIIK